MAKSIRISDDLYDLAQQEAALMHRSLAQQIEHWVKLGVGLEHDHKTTLDDVRSTHIRYRHARDDFNVRTGKKKATDLWVIPESIAKNAKVVFPPDAVFDPPRKPRKKAK